MRDIHYTEAHYDVSKNLAPITGLVSDDVACLRFVGRVEDDMWHVALVFVTEGGRELPICHGDGDTFDKASKITAFIAASYFFFERLDPRERNCEDATNRLAYESWGLWADDEPTGPFTSELQYEIYRDDSFYDWAKAFVFTCGPSAGIGWEDF